MAQQTLVQRIALDGGADIKAQLAALGAEGEAAFKKLQQAASQFKGPNVSSLQRAQVEIANLGKAFSSAGKQLEGFGRSMSLFVSAPIAGLGALAVKNFTDFDTAMGKVATHIDTTKESLDGISQAVLDIGKNTPVSINDLANALAGIRQAGISASDGLKVLKGSAELAVASDTSVADASSVAASAIVDFGLKSADQAKVFDLLFRAADAGRFSLTDLTGIFGKLGQTTQGTHVQLDEYLASLSTLTATGINVGAAQKELNTIMSNLTKGTAAATEVFQKMGVDGFDALATKSGGLIPALGKIVTALHGNAAAMDKVFGSAQNTGAVLELLQNGALKTTDTLHGMRSGVDAVGAAFGKVDANAGSAFQKIQNESQAASIDLGKDLAPVFITIGKLLADVTDAFAKLPTGVRQTIEIVAGAVAIIGPALLAIGVAFAGIGAALAIAAPSLAVIGPILLGIIAVAAVTAAEFKVLSVASDFLASHMNSAQKAAAEHAKTMDQLRAAVQRVKDGVPGATEALKGLADSQGKAAIAAAQDAVAQAQAAQRILQVNLELQKSRFAAGDVGPGVVNAAAAQLKAATDGIAKAEGRLTDLRKEMNNDVASSLADVVTGSNTASNAISTIGKAATNTSVTVLRGFGSGKGAVDGFSKQVVNVSRQVDAANASWTRAFANLHDGVQATLTPIAGFSSEITKLGPGITQIGSGATKAVDGLKSGVTQVGTALRQVNSDVQALGATQEQLKSAANLTVIATGAQQVVTALQAAAEQAKTVANDIVASGQIAVTGWAAVPQAIADAATQAAAGVQTLVTAFNGVGQAIAEAFAGIGPAVQSAFNGVVAEIQSQLSSIEAAVGSFVGSMQAQLSSLESAISQAEASLSSAQAAAGHAGGGAISGPGTGTSDSILARLSNGEFVIKAAAVGHYGQGFFQALNSMRLPRFGIPGFSMGGFASAIGEALSPMREIPQFAAGGAVSAGRPINISLDGQTFGLTAPEDTASSLGRYLMGRRARSAGHKPSWYR